MNKKIIAVAILMLAIVVVFAACKKDGYEVSYTVPGENGEVIEIYKDKDGNEFVTNANGDKIPVTTDKDGFYDDVAALITQTTAPANTGKGNTTTTTKADANNTTTTTTKADKDNSTTPSQPAESTTGKQITIDETPGQEDSISWQEIVDAANKANKA